MYVNYKKELESIVNEISLLEYVLTGIPFDFNLSVETRTLDHLNAYLFYLKGIAIKKGLL